MWTWDSERGEVIAKTSLPDSAADTEIQVIAQEMGGMAKEAETHQGHGSEWMQAIVKLEADLEHAQRLAELPERVNELRFRFRI